MALEQIEITEEEVEELILKCKKSKKEIFKNLEEVLNKLKEEKENKIYFEKKNDNHHCQ